MTEKDKFFKNKRIIVTGGEGFIGSALVRRLKQEGACVKVFDVKNGFNICNWEKISSFRSNDFKNIDCLFHLAAISFIPYTWQHPYKTYSVNIFGTFNILEFCRQKKVKKIVFLSSYVYGRPKYLPIDEKHPLEPNNPYARSKCIAEYICQAYATDFGIKCVIIRPFNVYGVGQNNQFLIPSIVNQIRKKNNVILDDSRPKRDFIYIDDIIEALFSAAKYNPDTFEIFNIGYGRSYSVKEITRLLIENSCKNIKIQYRQKERKGEILNVVADITKARKKLNWKPKVKIAHGIKMILNQK